LLRWGLAKFFPGLVSSNDPPNLHLLNNWDCEYESLFPALHIHFQPSFVYIMSKRHFEN
jgi:hypothetical protein